MTKLICQYCAIGIHDLCFAYGVTEEPCCCGGEDALDDFAKSIGAVRNNHPGAKPKTGDVMQDVLSTGRKRAAQLLPDKFLATITCQWAGLLYAGGGVQPIVGCGGNKAQDRHHGPDKSTVNNDDDFPETGHNLHAICKRCHRRWHACNDAYYGRGDDRPPRGEPWLPREGECKPHDNLTKATEQDAALFETWFQLSRKTREPFNKYRANNISLDN